MKVEVHVSGGRSLFVSEVDGSRVKEAIARGERAIEVRELSGNRTVLNVANILRVEFYG